MADAITELFGEPIHVYTRAQALEDGVLVNEFELDGKTVSIDKLAREAGICFPVALTAALFADVCAIPKSKGYQDVTGRLWDVLSLLRFAIARCSGQQVNGTASFCYQLTMHVGRKSLYTVKAHFGPGDDGKPVITLMKVGES